MNTDLAKRGRERGILLNTSPKHLILVVLAVYSNVIPHYAVPRHFTFSLGHWLELQRGYLLHVLQGRTCVKYVKRQLNLQCNGVWKKESSIPVGYNKKLTARTFLHVCIIDYESHTCVVPKQDQYHNQQFDLGGNLKLYYAGFKKCQRNILIF